MKAEGEVRDSEDGKHVQELHVHMCDVLNISVCVCEFVCLLIAIFGICRRF